MKVEEKKNVMGLEEFDKDAKTVEVLLFEENSVPDVLKGYIKDAKSRLDKGVIDMVKTSAKDLVMDDNMGGWVDAVNLIVGGSPQGIYKRVNDDGETSYYASKNGSVVLFRIGEVRTNEPWMVVSKGGFESIVYLMDVVICIDKESNFYSFKG